MQEIVGLLQSPGFWFGSVFIAVLINLGTSYLQPLIDRAIGKFSKRRTERIAMKSAQFRMGVERMAFDAGYMQFMQHKEIRFRFSSLVALLLVIFLALIYTFALITHVSNSLLSFIAGIDSSLGLFLGFTFTRDLSRAQKLSLQLKAAYSLRWKITEKPWADDFSVNDVVTKVVKDSTPGR